MNDARVPGSIGPAPSVPAFGIGQLDTLALPLAAGFVLATGHL